MDRLLNINRKIDLTIVASTLALLVYGVVVVFSATRSHSLSGDDPYIFLKKQTLAIIIGVAALIIAAVSNYNRWKRFLIPLYLANLALLVIVLLIGDTINGSKSWIYIGSFQLQPSEFSKLILIVTLASFFASRRNQLDSVQDLVLSIAHVGVPMLLVLAQPDLGTALCYIAILLGMMLVAGFPARFFGYLLIAGVVFLFAAIQLGVLQEYQINRLTVFINPGNDPQGAGYNLLQSKIAVGSGQLTGKGLFSGTQAKLQFLPERHTDFIFSVVGEELGFVGTLFLLLLFFVLLMRGLRTAAYARNFYGALLAAGIVSLWLFQIMVNIGMTIGLMPITGIPLPFMSYGNSSLITHLAAVGILLNIYARRYV